VQQQAEFMSVQTTLSGVIAASSVALFHIVFAAIALLPRLLRFSPWWYALGSLTYPLYLLHNRVGKTLWDALTPWAPAWLAFAIVLSVALLLAAAVAIVIERRACGAVHKRLLHTAVRFRIVRPTRAAT
jgi:peptidoglycan/LPS O-acetylase OafA/YrhL